VSLTRTAVSLPVNEQCVAAAEKRQLTDLKCVQMKREQPK
jgi:hypothetical protein